MLNIYQVCTKFFELENINKFKFCNKKLYIFNEKSGMFDEDNDINIKNYLDKYEPEFGNFFNKNSNFRSFVSEIKYRCRDNDWINNNINSSLGYLLYNDGIYNMKTGVFKKEFDYNIVFFDKIYHDFPEYNKNDIDYVRKNYFEKYFIYPEQVIIIISIALAACDHDLKKYYFCYGNGSNGKSTFFRMLKIVFCEYVNNEFNNFNNRFKRIIYSEIFDDLLTNDLIKHINNENVKFIPNSTIFFMMNSIPEMDTNIEFLNFFEFIEFPNKFIGKEKIIDLNMSEQFIRGFTHLILDGYKDFLINGMPFIDQSLKNKYICIVNEFT